MRRFVPVAAGLATFLVTSPFLFGGGSGDGDIPVFRTYGDRVLAGDVPYRDFHPEYPPGAFLFFIVPSLGPDRRYLLLFQLLAGLGFVVTIVLLALLLARLRASWSFQCFALVFAGATPLLLGGFTLRRFDMWPTAICIAALLLLIADRPTGAFALLALGTVIKWYPLILLPLALLFVEPGRRLRSFASFCLVSLVLWLPFAIVGHGGLYNSEKGQADRHLHLDSIGSSVLLAAHHPVRLAFDGGGWSVFGSGAAGAADIQTAVQLLGIVLSWYLFARSRRAPWDLVGAAATTLAVAACLGKVLSPQFLLWFAPLLVLARSAIATVLFVAAMLLTHALFPARYGGLLAKHDGEIWLLLARNVCLVGVVVALLAAQVGRMAAVRAPLRFGAAHG
jgi:glycosyl transferase family 87